MTFDPQVTEQSAVDTIRRVKKLKSTSWLVSGVGRWGSSVPFMWGGAVVHLYVVCMCVGGRGSGASVCGL